MNKRINIKSICTGIVSCIVLSCTDLEVPVYDKLATFWDTPEEVAAGVALPYVGLRSLVMPVYELNETTTDEVIVPTRGGDWYDGGVWEQMWKHTWTSDHGIVTGGWQFIYGNADHSGIAPINLILENLSKIDPALAEKVDRPTLEAQLKTIRAFYYYQGLDLFGNIPIVENNNTPLSEIVNRPRGEVFEYVEKELLDNLSLLPTEVSAVTYGRPTRWFTEAILAKLYLNAQVYTGTARWSDCIDACDAILSSNKYALEENFFFNFSINNEASKENIFVIPFDWDEGLNFFLIELYSLHYNSGETFGVLVGGVNGFCSTSEYLDLFDANDIRKKMFLTGQQYLNSQQYVDPVPDPANIQYDSEVGLPLIFDPEIKTFSSNDPEFKMAGARCVKWELNFLPPMSNDFAVFRLADIILMKAEAQLRNGDAAGALATINQKINDVSIRSRAGLPDFTSHELTLDNLLKERARELSWEGHRRNDLIRFGYFTDARVPEKLESEQFRILYPIPQPELDKNPYLVQNPGY